MTKVEWHTILTPGCSTLLGIGHTLIAVSVGKPYDIHEYIIEKADLPSFPNDVNVSHWANVKCSIEDPPINILQMCNIVSDKRVVMSDLIEAVIDLGPYHLAQRNRHQGALAVYNRYASEEHKVRLMPYQFLTNAVSLLQTIGIVVKHSPSHSVSGSAVYATVSQLGNLFGGQGGGRDRSNEHLSNGRAFALSPCKAGLQPPILR